MEELEFEVIDLKQMWFQQDELPATPFKKQLFCCVKNFLMIWSRSEVTRNGLQEILESDLTSCYFLWEYLNSQVYGNNPQIIEKFKRKFEEIWRTGKDVCKKSLWISMIISKAVAGSNFRGGRFKTKSCIFRVKN